MPTLPALYDENCDLLFEIVPKDYPGMHEATALIAVAACLGVSTEATRVFLSSPPCPDCAEILNVAGVTTVYHRQDKTMSFEDRQAQIFYLLARGVDLVSMHEGDFQ
jgi:deoxycytidylate deaminase